MPLTEPALLATGFEAAILGLGYRFTQPCIVYDRQRCLDILVERDGMTEEGAEEFFEFNVAGAWCGEGTPIFVTLGDRDAVVEQLERQEED